MKKHLSALAGVGLLVLALQTPVMAEEAPNSADIVKVAERYLAAYSSYDTEAMAPYFSDDAVFQRSHLDDAERRWRTVRF